MRRAGIAHHRRQVVGHLGHARTLGKRPHRPAVRTRHHQHIDLARRDPGLLQRGRERRVGQRPVRVLAEPLLPHPRRRRTRQPPPIQELLGRRRLSDHLSDHRLHHHRTRTPPPRHHHHAHQPHPATRYAHQTTRPASASATQPPAPTSQPPTGSSRPHPPPTHRRPAPAQRERCWRSSYPNTADPVVENNNRCGRLAVATWRSAPRAASTAIDVGSSSNDATARVPFPPPSPNTAAISDRLNRQ